MSDYELGKNITIVSATAETVSNLHQRCHKQVQIPDSLVLKVVVPAAEFSFNRYYEYSGLNGVTNTQAYDAIFIYPGTCDTMDTTSHVMTDAKSGTVLMVNGSSFCLEIAPELEHRNLGGHRAGGMIIIDVEVLTKVCDIRGPGFSNCTTICSADGPVYNCLNTSNIQRYNNMAA